MSNENNDKSNSKSLWSLVVAKKGILNMKLFFIIIMLVLYGIFILVSGILHGVYFQNIELFKLLSHETTPTSYQLSFYASAEQDFWFFTFIGIAVFLLGLRDPKEECLASKVKHIFPDIDDTTEHFQFLLNKVDELSCVAEESVRHITIESAPECLANKAFKLNTKSAVKVKNIHHNSTFSSDEMQFKLKSDLKDDNGVYGQVLDLSLITSSSDTKDFIDGVHTIMSNPSYEENYTIKLEPGETVSYRTHLWLYHSVEEPIRSYSSRFTSLAIYKFTNKLSFPVSLYEESTKNTYDLAPEESHELSFKNLKTGHITCFKLLITDN